MNKFNSVPMKTAFREIIMENQKNYSPLYIKIFHQGVLRLIKIYFNPREVSIIFMAEIFKWNSENNSNPISNQKTLMTKKYSYDMFIDKIIDLLSNMTINNIIKIIIFINRTRNLSRGADYFFYKGLNFAKNILVNGLLLKIMNDNNSSHNYSVLNFTTKNDDYSPPFLSPGKLYIFRKDQVKKDCMLFRYVFPENNVFTGFHIPHDAIADSLYKKLFKN